MRIIICGPTCSGKNILIQRFVDRRFKKDVSYTTRKKRNNEIDGEDYHFINKKGFEELIENGKFYEYVIYKGNYYGTLLDSWKNSEVFIMETDGIESISEEDRKNSFIIYLDISERYRISRMRYERKWNKKDLTERLKFDRKKFYNFSNYDLKITNPNF